MKILHIHQDFPDGREYPFTKAVVNLIEQVKEQAPEHEHFVLSINRTSNPFKISVKRFDYGLSVVYWAIPLTLIYLPIIKLNALWFHWLLRSISYDIIHGHTSTTEGFFSRYLSVKNKCRYVLSVRGGSDLHNYKRLKFERNSLRKNYTQASHIFWVSKWYRHILERTLNIDLSSNSSDLPNICDTRSHMPPKSMDRTLGRFFTVLSFHQHKRKGIVPLIDAIKELCLEGKDITLDIYGSGPQSDVETINNYIFSNGLGDKVFLKGKLPHKRLLDKMGEFDSLLLPARNETFGMAYVEAVARGCTLLYHRNTGIDGYFDTPPVGVGVTDQSIYSIKEAILDLMDNHKQYANNVKKIHMQRSLDRFSPATVATSYLEKLESTL